MRKSSVVYWLVSLLAIIVLGVLAFILIAPGLTGGKGPFVLGNATSSQIDEQMGNLKVEFSNAILKEGKETAKLIVYEQNLEIDQKLDDSWFGWDIFKKTKTMTIVGKGQFIVDLSALKDADITLNEEYNLVQVSIPEAVLDNVNIDESKIRFNETDNGILRFGDIKVTPEQQAIITDSAKKAMTEKLDTALTHNKADAAAKTQIKKIFDPVVQKVNKDYWVVVIIKK
ncbi:MAG: DUF4230 domain-containing protein [Oscillospiraceae bacterium]|jgi:hypothetical protein|nr:DUF4230 domain-containing protein [Oscillospiraceae bacterium]